MTTSVPNTSIDNNNADPLAAQGQDSTPPSPRYPCHPRRCTRVPYYTPAYRTLSVAARLSGCDAHDESREVGAVSPPVVGRGGH